MGLTIHPSRHGYNRNVHNIRSVAMIMLYDRALGYVGSTSALRYANPSGKEKITGLRWRNHRSAIKLLQAYNNFIGQRLFERGLKSFSSLRHSKLNLKFCIGIANEVRWPEGKETDAITAFSDLKVLNGGNLCSKQKII